MSTYSSDWINDVKRLLEESEKHFKRGDYSEELYYLERAKSSLDNAIIAAKHEQKLWTEFNS